jgi:hypothetical protein
LSGSSKGARIPYRHLGMDNTLLVFSVISTQIINTEIVSRETMYAKKGPKMTDEKRNPTIRAITANQGSSGVFQYEFPDCRGEEVPKRNGVNTTEPDRPHDSKSRQKEANIGLIKAFVIQTGFCGFHKQRRVYVNHNSHIWDTSPQGWESNQKAIEFLFGGYAPNFWEVLLLLVVGVSNETGSAPLPLINYITETYARNAEEIRDRMGKMGIPELSNGAR